MKKIRLPEMIDYFRKENNWTMKEFGKKLNKSESAISKWISGDRSPMVEDFEKMVTLFKTDPDTLMYGAQESTTVNKITKISSQLEDHRQETVLKFSKMQLDEQKARSRRNIRIKVIDKKSKAEPAKLYPVKAKEHVALAAGMGFSYDDTGEYATYYTLRNDFPRFDEAVPVDGDSMEPLVHDCDIALIRTNFSKVDGSIYAFDYDGKSYIKYLYFYDDRIVIKSENKEKFDDWEITFEELAYDGYLYFNIIGEVVDWFTPEIA